MAIAASYPELRPSLLLDFANAKAVDPRITFTRSTTAKYYDGVTTAKAEENLLLQSQTFDNASWTKSNTTVSANSAVAPDGTSTADLVYPTTTGTNRGFYQLGTAAYLTTAVAKVFSVYAKASGISYIVFYDAVNGGRSTWFDVSTGTVGTVAANHTASIVDVGGGWYRCVVTTSIAWHTNAALGFLVADADNNATATTSGTNGVLFWGAQLEQRSAVTAYTPTTTQPITNYIPVLQTAAAGVPRIDHNPVTGECLGLLIEEQRTNLLPWSESFRSQTLAVTGVSGTFVNGETVTATGGGTGIYVLADSTGASFAIFNGSGTFTGTLTGGTSGATATISSSVDNWTTANSTVTANTVVAPDGTLTGDRLVEDTNSAAHGIGSITVSITAGTNYTMSFYIKGDVQNQWAQIAGTTITFGTNVWANFDLINGVVGNKGAAATASIQAAGNGWYKCVVSAPATTSAIGGPVVYLLDNANTNARAPSFTGDGYSGVYIWGAQLEAGAFPTSQITTVATQETRNADAASMTGTNFSSWYNAGEGTLYGEAKGFFMPAGVSFAVATARTGSTNAIGIGIAPDTGGSSNIVRTNDVGQVTFNAAMTNNVYHKVSMSYATNDFVFSVDGGAAQVDTTGILPVVDSLVIGQNRAGSVAGSEHIKKFAYYPQALTAANLQALTA